jgi:hypothetical protein
VRREEIEDGGESTAEKIVPKPLPELAKSALETETNSFATGGFTKLRGEGMPCESCETVQQR